MKGSALAALSAILVAAACQESLTSPPTAADIAALDARLSNPPPPPIDTGATGGIAIQTFSLQQEPSTSARALPAAPGFERYAGVSQSVQSLSFFTIPVTYFLNPNENSGYLHFHSDNANSVKAAANGMVKYKKGEFDGKGKVEIDTFDGLLIIDLKSIISNISNFGRCQPVIPSLTPTESIVAPPNSCFQVTFGTATLNGDPVGPVTLTPGCYPREENDFCDNFDSA